MNVKNIDLIDHYHKLFTANLDMQENGTPDFIKEKRLEGMKAFQKLGIPDKSDERYKYTDLQEAFKNGFKKYLTPKSIEFNVEDIFKCDIPELNTHVVLLLNGWYYNRNQMLSELPGGVIVGSFAEAAKQYPELVAKHFGTYAQRTQEGVVALNTAFVRDGIFLYVPKNTVMDKPIQIINLLMDEEDGMTQHRNLFVVEDNAQAQVVVCDHTLSAANFLTNSVTETYIAPNARMDYVRIQNEHNGSRQVSNLFFHQERDSYLAANTITLHGGLIRNNSFVTLNGQGAESNVYGLYLTDKGQHIDNFVNVDHKYPNCQSSQLFKGVLDDYATGAFRGRVHVAPDAQKTQAYQANNSILLTDDAEMHTKPQLEIYADDVKCSHGATIGQLDESAMFYLRSRGINTREARLLLMYAFAHDVIGKIPLEPLEDRIQELVDKRLRGELSRCNFCQMHCH